MSKTIKKLSTSDLVEQNKWSQLRSELKPGLDASEAEFVTLDAAKIIKEAKARRKADNSSD